MERRQRELLRLAYLLSGDAERAVELAAATLVDLLGDPPEQLDQPTHELALELARRYLRHPARSTWLEQSGPARYTVDDERSRTKVALDRLEPRLRALLVLSQVAGLPELQLRAMLGSEGSRDQQVSVEQARERLSRATGRAADAPVVGLLNRLLIDAPAVDLWPEIEDAVGRAWAARRRSEWLQTAAAVAVVIAALGGAAIWLGGFLSGGDDDGPRDFTAAAARPWPPVEEQIPTPAVAQAAFAAAPTLPPAEASLVTVIDLHFLRTIEQAGDGRSALDLYDPATNTSTPLLTAGGAPLISPDGGWIVSVAALPDAPGMALVAGGSLEGGQAWEARIATPRALTLGHNRIYALNLQSPDTYQIQVLALDSGALLSTWPVAEVALTPSTFRSAQLVLAPEGDRLALLTARIDREQEGWVRELVSYALESGEALDSFTLDTSGAADETAFSIRYTYPVAGEHALYSIVQDEAASRVRLQFLDLDSGAIAGLLLPLEARAELVAARRGEAELHLVPSNTGAVLYVIQSRQRRVAVVDMRSRSLIGVFPFTASEETRGSFESNLNHVVYLEALLSPDGTRMYLAVNRERNTTLSSYPLQAPVWVIDTTTWEVLDRWVVDGMPRRMTMSGDGAHVYLQTARADRSVRLTTLATATGATVNVWETLPTPEWTNLNRIGSLEQVYLDQYGIRPRSGPDDPLDNPVLAVLPGVSVEAEGAVAGVETVLTLRIVHPVTGELATTDRTLRFDPAATVVVELSNGESRAIIVPAGVEPGIYRGPVRLDGAGAWGARVTVINPGGTRWTAHQPAAIEVAEGLVAENGSAYRFLVRPANPVNRRTITVRVWMVESQSRERLPEEIEFLDQISDDVRIVLTHPSGERVDEPLVRIDHASFLGWVRFGAAGEWTAEIVLGLGSGERLAIGAGTLEINDLTEPYERGDVRPTGSSPASD